MLYKTIILESLQENPALYEELRSSKRLLKAMEAYAVELRESHLNWQATLAYRQPGRDPSQIAAEALEWVISEWRERLRSMSPSDADHPPLIAGRTATNSPATPLA